MKKFWLMTLVLMTVCCFADTDIRGALNNAGIEFDVMKNGDLAITDSGITVFVDKEAKEYNGLRMRCIYAVPYYKGQITDDIRLRMFNCNGDLKFGCWLMLTDKYCAYRVQVPADCSSEVFLTGVVFAYEAAKNFERDVLGR